MTLFRRNTHVDNLLERSQQILSELKEAAASVGMATTYNEKASQELKHLLQKLKDQDV